MKDEVGKSTQEFSRFEFKYILNEEIKNKIEKQVKEFMKFDGFVHTDLSDSYFVRSLYYDSPSSSNFYEKIDGIKKRKKFRLRTYDKTFEKSPVFIEQKGRNVNRVYKLRTNIDKNDIDKFYLADDFEYLINNYGDKKIINEFITDKVKRNISPVVLVDYIRRPYVSDYDMNFRITFDSHIMSRPSKNLFPEKADNENFKKCLPGYTILEVKFHRKVPAWFHKIIMVYNLERVSVSKFVLGMKTSKIAIDLS
tara:strand:- start:8995 stop:9750 length:756 start_codon:yes stop_codon:yes gene_type:complete